MSRCLVVCIGSVTATQYQDARLTLLREGRKPSITHIKPARWLSWDHVADALQEYRYDATGDSFAGIDRDTFIVHLLPYLEEFGAHAEGLFESEGWLSWFAGIRPNEIGAIVIGDDERFDERVSDCIEANIVATWPDQATRPAVYRVHSTGYAVRD